MARRPNILFLLNDHQIYYRHGWDHGPAIRRPYFNRLASEGISFSRAYTASPLCGPARRSMLTALYPHNHGEVKNDTGHPFDRPVYLDILAENGYTNYYYGKWHAGPGTAHEHNCAGFSYPSYNNPYNKPEYLEYLKRRGLPPAEHVIERSFLPETSPRNDMRVGERYRSEGNWCNEHASGITITPRDTHESFFLVNLACDQLRRIAASGGEKPFAMRVDFWGPHQPYFPTAEYADLYSPKDIPEYPSFTDTLENKPDVYFTETNVPLNENHRLIVPSPLPWEEWQKVLARAYGHVTMIDAAGGRILQTLDELALSDNTFVVWVTDHGDAVACHGGHFDKASYMPEEMVRIPLAMRWPSHIEAGTSTDHLASNMDVPATVLDAAGLRFPGEIDGSSLLAPATGEPDGWRTDLMCETHGHGENHIGRLVVTDRYKYIYNRGQKDELYDLREDPYEMDNLIDQNGCEGVLQDMRARLRRWQERTHDPHGMEA